MSEEEQIILPERFKRVEYLEDNGTQWINTEYVPTNNTGLWVDAQQIVHSNGFPIGSGSDRNSPADGFMSPRWLKSTGNTCGYGWIGWTSWGNIGDGNRFKSSLNYLNDKKAILTLKDGRNDTYTGNLDNLNFTPTKSLHLFASNGSPINTQWYGRIYEAKISEETEIVRHFVPVYDTYSARGCMYELIEGKAYYNKGTGDFLYNLDIEDEQLGILYKLPEGFTKVNYLIANGSQYIDTNYVPTNETGYYLEGQGYVSESSVKYYFGFNETNDWNANQRIYFGATPNNYLGWMTSITVTNVAANLRQETKVALNFLNSRKCITTINDADIINELSDLTFTPSQKIFLFNVNLGGNVHTGGLKGRIDTFLISEGDQIVRQFVPCLDADGIPCMYELYTGTVHYNQGAGQFSYPREYTNDPINLPAGYTKCVYLQSDGTQWIDTGVLPNNEIGLLLKALRLNNADAVPFGAREEESIYVPRYSTKNKAMNYAWVGGFTAFYYDKADDLQYISCLNLYNDRLVKMSSLDTDWVGVLDKNLKTFTTQSLWLFSHNWEGSYNTTYSNWGGRIYRAQITQGDSLIRDFVPCLDTDNRPCMYDLVNQQPYYNQSGGTEFAYCVEHQLPSDFIKLKYLESSGTQFIKTGYVPTNNTGLYIDAYNTVVRTDWTQPFALRETNGNTYVSVGRVNKATNGAAFGWGAYTTSGGMGDVRYEATLNWLNDKKSIITAPAFDQRVNTLSDLSFTPTFDLCMFGIHYYDGTYNGSSYRIYRAKISEGSEIVRDFVPAYDGRRDKPCMYDLINNVAYYNDGTGEFITNRDFEGTYTGFTGLGCIGNKLGSDYNPVSQVALPYGYTKADFLESTGTQYIKTEVDPHHLSYKIVFDGFNGSGSGLQLFGVEKYTTPNYYWYGTIIQNNNNGIGFSTTVPAKEEGNTHISAYDNPIGSRGISEVNFNENYVYTKGALQERKLTCGDYTERILATHTSCALFANQNGGNKCKARVYSLQGNYHGIEAMNFIPAIDPSGVPCMYDTVTDRPFYNNDTGQFIVGMKTLSQAISLRLPETGGTLQLSLPTNDNVEYYEEKIRANNPSWNFTFSYH